MNTIKFDISINDLNDKNYILQKQKNYSYAFKSLYSNLNKISDTNYITNIRNKFKLNSREINGLLIEVQAKNDAVTKIKQNTEQRIVELETVILTLKKLKNKTKSIVRKIFKLNNKLEYHKSRLSKDITFGTLDMIRRLSYLNNDKINNKDEILKIKNEYKNKRLLSINYVGCYNEPNSNRHFSFDFENNKIIYKPYKGRKIELNYILTKNKQKELIKLQKIKDNGIIPITVRLSHEYITISFDDEKLNGYGFDEISYKREISKIDKTDLDLKKNIGIKYKKEQTDRKHENKNINRYCSIDLNPEFIGVSIFDKVGDSGELKLIDVFTVDMTTLMYKSNKSSDDIFSKYLTNKRKFEIGNIYKQLFNKVKHYKCAYFIIEDLKFKVDNMDTASKEANRKNKNMWNREYQYKLINKYCNIIGVILIEVNPCYSSFIGNIMYSYFDPSNSAIEIGRRGIIKYIKGNKFYPMLTGTIIDTALNRLGLTDVQWLKTISWVEFFKCVKETGVKYRWQLNETNYCCFSKNVNKSKWKIYSFT